jgi:hypothetical protein
MENSGRILMHLSCAADGVLICNRLRGRGYYKTQSHYITFSSHTKEFLHNRQSARREN